jgi:hypothetical protein
MIPNNILDNNPLTVFFILILKVNNMFLPKKLKIFFKDKSKFVGIL